MSELNNIIKQRPTKLNFVGCCFFVSRFFLGSRDFQVAENTSRVPTFEATTYGGWLIVDNSSYTLPWREEYDSDIENNLINRNSVKKDYVTLRLKK